MSRAHKLRVLCLWALAVLLAGWQIAHTRFSADLSAFLPATTDSLQRVLIDQIKSGAPARLLFIGIEGGTLDARVAASRRLAAAMRASGRFDQVSNGDNGGWADAGRWIFERRYLLSPAVVPGHFDAAGLRAAFDETLSLLGTPAGNAIKPLLDQDPTGEVQRIAEGLLPARSPRSEQGVWTSHDARRTLILAGTHAAGADLDGQAAAIATVRSAFARLTGPDGTTVQEPAGAAPQGASPGSAPAASVAAAAAPAASAAAAPAPDLHGLTLQMSGTPVFAVDSRAQIQHEVEWLSLAGTALVAGLLLLAFASPLALGVATLPVATGVVVGIAAVGLAFGGVHAATLGFGSALIGEAVDYAIYYLIQAHSPPGPNGVDGPNGPNSPDGPNGPNGPNGPIGRTGPGWRRWLASGWPTVRLGMLTSVCGFAALVFSGFPGLAQLGVFSIAGLLAAAAATRFVLPVLMPEGAGRSGLRRPLGRAARAALAVLPRTRWLWVVLGLGSALLVWQRSDLWQARLSSLSPVPQAALDLDASLRADLMAGDGGALVVVQAPDAQAVLQRAEAASARLEALVDAGAIAGFDSVTRLVPSVQTQRLRQAALPAAPALRAALAEATRGGPLKAERLAPFVEAVERARQLPPATLASVKDTPIGPLVDALMLHGSDGRWSALLPVQPSASGLDAARLAAALRGLPETQVLDIGAELGRLYQRYLGEARTQALLGALGVVLLMAGWLRSPRRLLAVCQPLLLAVLITLGGLALLDVRLGILHLVGMLLVVAVGSNYALFFDLLREDRAPAGELQDARSEGDADDLLASLLLANAATVLSFGLIASSQIPALSAIGRVVAPGALLALVLAAAFSSKPSPSSPSPKPAPGPAPAPLPRPPALPPAVAGPADRL